MSYNYKFDSITDKNLKQVYKELWESFDFPCEVLNTWWKHGNDSKDSQNSFQFSIKNVDRKNITKKDADKICSGLKTIFDITNASFSELFHQACSGSGSEYKKIMCLHSSSLCALLFFNNVSEENPLILQINNKGVIFTKVLFEYKNKVIANPSNIDVVLVGRYSGSEKKVIFFLESKFSEYLEVTNEFHRLGLGYLTKYSKIYNDKFLGNVGLSIIKDTNNQPVFFEEVDKKHGNVKKYNGIQLKNMEEETYIEGLKQMISHYIGIEHFIGNDLEDERKLDYSADTDVYLGEILFDFNFELAKDSLNTYSSYYKKLATGLNGLNPNIHVVNEILRYSSFGNKDFSLPEPVKKFYKI